MDMNKVIKKVARLFGISNSKPNNEAILLAIGAMLSKQQYTMQSNNINDYEFKIFSQWGDDGIIQYLIKNIDIKNETFIEFGVENYLESNTRFLLMNNNWSGFVMDGSTRAMKSLEKRDWYWKYSLTHKAAWIDKENINSLLDSTGLTNIGILHIDIDGNDYYILKEIDLAKLNPSILIMEYNSLFGKERMITVPYDRTFTRRKAHYSNLFYGASLAALNDLATKKGYCLIGCNLAGNNAYFVRKDLLNERIVEQSVNNAFVDSKFREGRKKNYSLSYATDKDRFQYLKGLDVLNIETNQIEQF